MNLCQSFNDWISIVTIYSLLFTTISGFQSVKKTSEANELSILPLIVIKFVGKPMENRSLMAKNIGNGSAYDLQIQKIVYIITDIQYVWELFITLKGVNVLEVGEKKNLTCIALQNSKVSDIKDFLIYHLDPIQEHERTPMSLLLTFKNLKGDMYYSKLRTGKGGLTFLISPRRLNFIGFIIIFGSNFIDNFLIFYHKFVWKFKKPYIK
ncbi:MAG: hypothetical protein NUV52_04395 [Candidatus Roizmanbacteria bacterium]|nr:hypothetical protein [Candidatus Roizmanbacteria bacterium]